MTTVGLTFEEKKPNAKSKTKKEEKPSEQHKE